MGTLLSVVLLFLVLGCSRQVQTSIFFEPELTIGGSSEIAGTWFGSLVSFYIDSQENIYCLDGQERSVKVFDRMGRPLYSFGRKGNGPGEFLYPLGIVVSRDGFLYILDGGRRNVSKFTTSGKYVASVSFTDRPVRMELFSSGNIVLEIAKIDIQNIQSTEYELWLLDGDLRVLNDSVCAKVVSNLAWVEGTPDGKLFTVQIPYAPQLVWEVIGDKLYVGYSEQYKIFVFSEDATQLGEILMQTKREKVSSSDGDRWKREVLDRFRNRPGFSAKTIEKSLGKISIPKLKPAFSKFLNFENGLLVLTTATESGTPGFIYDMDDNLKGQAVVQYNDFRYFRGKYYRIIQQDGGPRALTRYHLKNQNNRHRHRSGSPRPVTDVIFR